MNSYSEITVEFSNSPSIHSKSAALTFFPNSDRLIPISETLL